MLTGEYPNTSSRLVSSSIQLPDLDPGEELQLWFWHWAKINSHDAGRVQISHEESPGVWSEGESITGSYTRNSGVWSPSMKDISTHAGLKVRIAFYLVQDSQGYVDAGWYIDDAYLKGPCIDNDGDGYGHFISDDCTYHQVDCNDADPDVNPGHAEIPGNRIDDNCNGLIDERGIAMPWLQLLLLDE